MDPKVAAIMAKLQEKDKKKEEPKPKEPTEMKPPKTLEEFMKVENLVSGIFSFCRIVHRTLKQFRKIKNTYSVYTYYQFLCTDLPKYDKKEQVAPVVCCNCKIYYMKNKTLHQIFFYNYTSKVV